MNRPQPFSFLACHIQNSDTLRVIAQIDELKDAGATDSEFMTWKASNQTWSSFDFDWHAHRMDMLEHPEVRLIFVGPEGITIEITKSGVEFEGMLDDTDEGPKRRGHIRDIKQIEEHMYVCGMGRQVYRRESLGAWKRWDQGMVQPLGQVAVSGLNCLDGLTQDCIYAVGFNGEIWHFWQGSWVERDSPTNVLLSQVKCVSEDKVYIAGQLGTILCGSHSQWQLIDHSETESDFWGMAWFQNHLYLASDEGLFRLDKQHKLELIDMGLGNPVTCRHLYAKDGMLLSVGPKHVCLSHDGKVWRDISP